MNRHKNSQGFYRPESYFGLWSILPDRLSQYLGVVATLDLGAMAAAAMKSDTSPSVPLPTEKPDAGKAKKEKQAALAAMDEDIQNAADILDGKKAAKADRDQADIEKGEKDLEEKKAARAKLADEIDAMHDEPDEDNAGGKSDGDEDNKKTKSAATGFDPNQLQAGPDPLYELHGDTAIITMSGPITKYPTSFQAIIGGASTVATQHAIRQANADPEVSRIVLKFDSPGGTSAGTYELMDDVKASAKPLWSYGEDMMASAAYFAACGADYIACNPTAMVGSVGTLVMLRDTSGKCKMEGIKMLTIGTGKYKGTGMEGTEITDEQKAYLQNLVNDTNSHFVSAVKDSRKLDDEKLAAVCDAGLFVGQKAVDAGLVDAVMSFDAFLAKFEADTDKFKLAAAANEASLLQMRAAELAAHQQHMAAILAASGGSHVLAWAQLNVKATIEQATAAHAQQLMAAEALRKADAASAAEGHAPLSLGKGADSVENEFMAKVKAYQNEHKCSTRDAMSACVKAFPDLYQEYFGTFKMIESGAGRNSVVAG